jgi:hypothetical protein
MNKQEIIAMINDYRSAHNILSAKWHEAGLNELDAVTQYPFDKSFDELMVTEWCDAMLAEIDNVIDYKISSTEYLNTGGNCMVHIAKVYLPAEKRMIFVYSSDDASSINKVDWLTEGLDYEEDFCEDTMDWREPRDEHKYYDLIQECRVLCMIADCKHYGTTFNLRYEELPQALKDKLSPADVEYLIESEELVETNGVDVNIPSQDDNVRAAKKCQQTLSKLMDLMDTNNNKFLDTNFKIYVGDELFEFYNCAAVYSGIEDCMKYIIDQE